MVDNLGFSLDSDAFIKKCLDNIDFGLLNFFLPYASFPPQLQKVCEAMLILLAEEYEFSVFKAKKLLAINPKDLKEKMQKFNPKALSEKQITALDIIVKELEDQDLQTISKGGAQLLAWINAVYSAR